MPTALLFGFAGICAEFGAWDLAALIIIGLLAFLRTGELFAMKVNDSKIIGSKIITSLQDTKASFRKKAHEVVVVHSKIAADLLSIARQNLLPDMVILRRSVGSARRLFKALCVLFCLEDFNFQWYSLRRGGASYDFSTHGSMEKTLMNGRWESTKVARVYVNESLASSVLLSLSSQSIGLSKMFAGRLRRLIIDKKRRGVSA